MGPEMLRVERRLAAIFAADVAGYSRLMHEDEVGTLRTLTACREMLRSARFNFDTANIQG